MTVIAYRNGIMAADSRAFTGGRTPIGQKMKIRRLSNATLVGASSSIPGGGEAAIKWFAGGRKAEDPLPEKFTLLAVNRDGDAFYATDSRFVSGPIKAPYFAIGSGEEFALGAFATGASAKDAVRIAIQHDVWSDFPIQVLWADGSEATLPK